MYERTVNRTEFVCLTALLCFQIKIKNEKADNNFNQGNERGCIREGAHSFAGIAMQYRRGEHLFVGTSGYCQKFGGTQTKRGVL
jgi:hypothetical protein